MLTLKTVLALGAAIFIACVAIAIIARLLKYDDGKEKIDKGCCDYHNETKCNDVCNHWPKYSTGVCNTCSLNTDR